MTDLSVILPTYNESANIIRLITEIKRVLINEKVNAEIIVVDDNSPDETALSVRRKFDPKKNSVMVYVRKKDRGLAKSILYGIQKAKGEAVLVMDTDYNHDPKEIPVMLISLEKSQLVIGSRYIKGGGMENRLRYYLSFIFNLYVRLLLRVPVYDNLSGFFAMKRKDLETLPLMDIFDGFGEYFMRLIYHAHKRGDQISETPVYYKNRVYGVSKSRFLEMFFTYTICALKLRINPTL